MKMFNFSVVLQKSSWILNCY